MSSNDLNQTSQVNACSYKDVTTQLEYPKGVDSTRLSENKEAKRERESGISPPEGLVAAPTLWEENVFLSISGLASLSYIIHPAYFPAGSGYDNKHFTIL